MLDTDAAAAAITPRTKAIMPVHLYGHPCDMDAVMALAKRHGLFVIEDCAEAIGAKYKGQPVGAIGHVGCFSFFANKTLTTGEGGMVTTGDEALFGRMAVLRDHGMAPDRRYWHETVGFNFRMTNIQAAIGLAQVERLDAMITQRKAVAAQYDRGLEGADGIIPQRFQAWADSMPWLYSIRIDPNAFGMDRDALGTALKAAGIETRPLFYTLQGQPAFRAYARAAAPNAAFISENGAQPAHWQCHERGSRDRLRSHPCPDRKERIMIDGKRCLAVAPARGGSKGLPRKNLRLLGDRPLVTWTQVEAAKSIHLDRCVLSTDDPEIMAAWQAVGHGRAVPASGPLGHRHRTGRGRLDPRPGNARRTLRLHPDAAHDGAVPPGRGHRRHDPPDPRDRRAVRRFGFPARKAAAMDVLARSRIGTHGTRCSAGKTCGNGASNCPPPISRPGPFSSRGSTTS